LITNTEFAEETC